jgi:hypothetical protein
MRFTCDIGLALPPGPTNLPTNTRLPDLSTSSQEGNSFPEILTVISHLPRTEDVSE